jgi:hypothetical protein
MFGGVNGGYRRSEALPLAMNGHLLLKPYRGPEI